MKSIAAGVNRNRLYNAGGGGYNRNAKRKENCPCFAEMRCTAPPFPPPVSIVSTADGLLTTYLQEESGGPPRKYYKLTQDGEAFLKELENSWQELNDTINHIKVIGAETIPVDE